jgi:type IX secretion system PorP/SprF family membrane protein
MLGMAQQVPQYSHYLFNQFQINPAVAGSKECLDMRFGYRSQWVGFENAPRTAFGSINGVIGKKKGRTKTFQAGGIMLESDITEPTSRTTVQLAYAYHFPAGRKTTASIGLYAGFTQYVLDVTGINTPFEMDPVLAGGSNSNLLIPEVTPGFWFKGPTFFLGASLRHVTANKIDDSDFRVARLRQHLALTGGKAIKMGDNSTFIPSTMIKFAPTAPLAVDVNAMFDFDQRLAVGVGYRNADAFVGLLKLNFLNYFTLGYAYDVTTSPLKASASNSHEVILGITACPFNGASGHVPCSAYD